MPANNPNSPNAATVQGPDPTGNLGYPIATVPATGSDPFPVTVIAGGGGAVTIADGADVNQGATTDAANTTGAVGTMSGKLRGILAILANVWDSINGRLRVDGSGVTQPVSIARPATATRTSVAASVTVVTLLAANASRFGATITNHGDKQLFVALGSGATLTNFTAQLLKFSYYEVPFSYTGIITGIWDNASGGAGSARITEVTT